MMKIPTIAKLDKAMGQVQFGNPTSFSFPIISRNWKICATCVLRETLVNNRGIAGMGF